MSDTKLYRLTSVIDDWPHRRARYNNVHVTWFVNKRDYDPGFDYTALLDRPLPPAGWKWDGDPADREKYAYHESLVDELFTWSEANQLAEYLREAHDTDVDIAEVTVPIDGRYMPISAIAVGGDCDFYMLSEHDDYTLPFKAWGYYRVDDDSLLFEPLADLLARVEIE